MKTIKIWWFKRQARKAYAEYSQIAESVDCGNAFTEYLSASASSAKNNFNFYMDRLSAIDPLTPSARL